MKYFAKKILPLFLPMLILFISCNQALNTYFLKEGTAFTNTHTSTDRKWTIMMYMAADNMLEGDAIKDINDLESFNLSSHGVSIISLLDRGEGYDGTNGNWEGTRLLEIVEDENGENGLIVSPSLSSTELALVANDSTELDMAKSTTLKNFIQFCFNHYKSENYALVIWGHGNGWRSITSDNFTKSTMSIPELRHAIEQGTNGKKLDAIIFDTSFAATIETLWELKNTSQFFAGTSGSIDLTGLDYKKVFSAFLGGEVDTNGLLSAIKTQEDFSIIHLPTIVQVKENFDAFSSIVASSIDTSTKQNTIKNLLLYDVLSYKSSSYPTDMFLDMYDLSSIILKNSTLLSSDAIIKNNIEDACRSLQMSIEDATNSESLGNSTPQPISVFYISFLESNVPDSVFPKTYVQENFSENTLSFIRESKGWVPTSGRNVSLLDMLFFTDF